MSLQEFLHMGGYAGYVWSSYALTVVVLAANVYFARRQFRTRLTLVKRRLAAGGQS